MKKLFDEIPCLENDRVILRPVAEGDAEALREMTLNPVVYRYLPTFLYEQQDPDIHAVIRGFYGDLFRKKQSLILAVCRKEAPETFCGLAEFYDFKASGKTISIGYRFLSRFWGKGIGSSCVQALLKYVQSNTEAELVTAHVIPGSTAGLR